MQALLKPVMQYLVYPLAAKLAGWVYQKYMQNQIEDNEAEIAKQRKVLLASIAKAENDEERINLSRVLAKLSRGEL